MLLYLLIIGYSLGAALPGIALVSVFVRARKKFKRYSSNKTKRDLIDKRFEPKLAEVRGRMESGDSVGDAEEPLYMQQVNILNAKSEAYQAEGVSYLSYGRVEQEMEEVFEGKPIDNYSLAIQDFWLIGLGLLIGALTSISSLFVLP